MLRNFVESVNRREVPKAKEKPTVAQVTDRWLEHKLRISRDLAESTVASIEWAMGHITRTPSLGRVLTRTTSPDLSGPRAS